MASTLFDSFKLLVDNELHCSVVRLGSFLMTAAERSSELLNPSQRYFVAVQYAESLLKLGRTKKAEQYFMKALQFRKTATSPSLSVESASTPAATMSTAEADVKFKLACCLQTERKLNEAVGALESVPLKQRSSKINMKGLWRQAADCFREVLRECPLAIEAAIELLQISDVRLNDVLALMTASSSAPSSARSPTKTSSARLQASFELPDFLLKYIRARSSMAECNYADTVSLLRELDGQSPIANNVQLLTDLAMAYYFAGEPTKAVTIFQRVHSLDPLAVDGMDVFAALLCDERRSKELESLAVQLAREHEETPQAWVAMGYLCKAQRKLPRALYFARKASLSSLAPANYAEALLLKGIVLLEMRKTQDALVHFQEALAISPTRFEVYEGIVHALLDRSKNREALAFASNSMKQLGPNARFLTLYASIFAKDATVPSSLAKAQQLLEKALQCSPHLLTAVYQLVEIYSKQGELDKAINLLRQQANIHVKSRLHQLLGDLLSKNNQKTEALDRYRFALSLDPENVSAITAMTTLSSDFRMKSDSGTGSDSTLTPDQQRMPASALDSLSNAPVARHHTRQAGGAPPPPYHLRQLARTADDSAEMG